MFLLQNTAGQENHASVQQGLLRLQRVRALLRGWSSFSPQTRAHSRARLEPGKPCAHSTSGHGCHPPLASSRQNRPQLLPRPQHGHGPECGTKVVKGRRGIVPGVTKGLLGCFLCGFSVASHVVLFVWNVALVEGTACVPLQLCPDSTTWCRAVSARRHGRLQGRTKIIKIARSPAAPDRPETSDTCSLHSAGLHTGQVPGQGRLCRVSFMRARQLQRIQQLRDLRSLRSRLTPGWLCHSLCSALVLLRQHAALPKQPSVCACSARAWRGRSFVPSASGAGALACHLFPLFVSGSCMLVSGEPCMSNGKAPNAKVLSVPLPSVSAA